MPFSFALKSFYETGFFELKNSEFSSKNIQDLEKAIKKKIEERKKSPYTFLNFFRIILENIQMIPDLPRKKYGSGPVIQHVPRRWTDNYSDFTISQMGSSHGFNLPINYGDRDEVIWHPKEEKTPLEILQKDLLSLLLNHSWRIIKLDQLFFFTNHQMDVKTTQDFYNELLKALAKNIFLLELTISPFSLSKYQDTLISFLAKTNLGYLNLEITEADPSSWEKLLRKLERSNFITFNLGNSLLDSSIYMALADLLDKNYTITIKLSEPTDPELLCAYQPLKKQLLKSGLERFKERRLTQDKLFQIAIETLEKLKSNEFGPSPSQQAKFEKQFGFLLKDQAYMPTDGDYWDVLYPIYQNNWNLINSESPSLIQLNIDNHPANSTQTMGSILLEKALEVSNQNAIQTLLNANANLLEFPSHGKESFLVKVLQSPGAIKERVLNHIRQKNQLEESDLLQLPVADGSRTIGYVLLEKALKTKNLSMLEDLLKINVNLFERPNDYEEPFLVKALQSKGTLKKMVVEYIQKNPQIMKRATEYFGHDSNLKNIFGKFKDHLDNYATHLIKKDNPSILVTITKKILMTWREIINFENPSDKRDQECAQMYFNLNEMLEVFEKKLTPYDTFDEMHKIIIKMKEKSVEAIRGFFNSSFLHEKILKLITEFEYELLGSKKSVFDKSIDQIKQAREQDRLVFNEKIEKMETENAAMKENQARMEAEINALRKQIGTHTFFSETKPDTFNLSDQTKDEHEKLMRP